MGSAEEKFINFCKRRNWKIYKIPELPNIKTPDFFVIANNYAFIVEVKNLFESGPERKDIEKIEIKGKIVGQSFDGWKEVDSIAYKIRDANQQFKITKSFQIPQIVIIYSDRQFVPLTKDFVVFAMYGKVFQRILIKEPKEKSINLPPIITDRTLRKDKNNLTSAVGFLENENGMFVVHNLWADITLPISIFSKENDINYVPSEVDFKEIRIKQKVEPQ